MKLLTAAAILALGAPTAALAEPIPAGVAAMIEAASKDPANLKVVADIAKQTNPGSAAEIDARLGEIAAAAEAARVESLSSQTFFEGWTGEGEAGGFISTGNAEETGLAVGLGLKKESLKWRHRVDGIVDYRSTEGTTTKEAFKLDTQDVDASVAARQVEYVQPIAAFPGQDLSESTIGGRLGGRLVWEINETTSLSEVVVAYFDSQSNTIESTTALTTRLSGALAARASFNIRTESDPPLGREQTDTTTRAALVYSF